MKKLLIVLGICVSIAHGQAARFGDQNPTQNTVVVPGTTGMLVRVVPNAIIQFCGWPANAVPCTNKVTTYTDITLTSACSTSTQVVLSGTSNCVGTADAQGNWGVWVPPGTYQYTFTYQGNNYGPFYALPVGATVATLNCPSAVNGAIGFMNSPTAFNCDPNFTTDGLGNWTSQSGRTIGPVNGFLGLIGGSASPGSQAKNKLGVNEFRWLARTGSSEYVAPPATLCTNGQVWGQLSSTTDGNGDTVVVMQCQNSSTGAEFQTNSVDNSNCTAGACPLLNLVAGSNIILTNTSGGNVTIAASGAAVPQMSSPVAPTLAVGGTPGASTVTYLIQGCQDGPTCLNHTLTSATATVTTANATLSSSPITLSAYESTSGQPPRCYNIYRTVGGPSQGKIATCVGKSFIDNGLAGDGTTATNTNTTVLDPNGLTAPLPGCNKIPAAPWGIDGPPCTPNAFDDEFTWGNGTWAPGDTNNHFWTWGSQTAGATAQLSNGTLILTTGATTTADYLIHSIALPVTPYTFKIWVSQLGAPSSATNNDCWVGFRESATGKMFTVGITSDQPPSTIAADGGELLMVKNWTSNTYSATFSHKYVGYTGNSAYVTIQNTGTNLVANFSDTGNGVGFFPANFDTETVATAFTTAPNQLLLGGVGAGGVTTCTFDFERRTQ